MSGRVRSRTRSCSDDFRRFMPAALAGPPLLFISQDAAVLALMAFRLPVTIAAIERHPIGQRGAAPPREQFSVRGTCGAADR
jgi:hypothetical protein